MIVLDHMPYWPSILGKPRSIRS